MIRTLFVSLAMIFSIVTVPTAGTAQAAEVKTVILDVQNMTCKFCPITVRKSLEKVDGVVSATADLDSKTAIITFDPDKTNVDALRKATTDAGYPSTLKQ